MPGRMMTSYHLLPKYPLVKLSEVWICWRFGYAPGSPVAPRAG